MKNTGKIVASLASVALLVALMVTLTFRSFGQIEKTAETRKRTFVLLNRANEVLSELKDAETGQRGYLLTGDEAFLKPYLDVRDSVAGHLKDLRQLTMNGAARKHLDAIAPLADAKLAEMSQVIMLRRNGDMTAVLARVGSGQGKRFMDSIRVEMHGFLQLEEDALAQHEAEFQSNMRRLYTSIVSASLCTLLFALSFAYLLYQRSQQRLKNLVHLETEHLLVIQEETNEQLQQANLTLQESQEKLGVTLNSIGDGVIATDAAGRMTLLNPVAESLTGWTQQEAAGRPVGEVFQIINQETRQPATIPVLATLAHGTTQGLANHTVLIARDGSERAIADSCAPIRDRDGQVVGAVLVFRDVTREYAAQQTLRDNAALIQTILNTVADGIVTLHADGGFVETVNPAAEQMFGYSAEELSGKSFSSLIPELDRDRHQGSLEHYSASAEARAIGLGREVMGRRKDGSSFPLEIAVNEMFLDGRRYFTGLLRDITTRKEAEEALLKAGALQSAIFNSANFSSIATDAKGVIQIFNVGAERMLGYAAAEMMDRITPADISDPKELIARAEALSHEFGTPIAPGFEALVFKASRGIEDIYELTYIRKDGSRLPAVVSVTALREVQGAIIGFLLIGTDNTARKQIEADQEQLGQRLRDHQFYTRSLFEANIDASMTCDPSGIITDVNKQMEVLTGCTRDELIGAPFKNCFADPERAETGIRRTLGEKKITDYELTARDSDGKETVVSCNATTFYDRDRKLQGVFAAARDVSERKRLDRVLREKNAELEAARAVAEKTSLTKSDFLANMSHELRTPLNSVIGFSEVLQDQLFGPINEKQLEYVLNILGSGKHLLSLINDILDLSKVESGKMGLELSSSSLRDSVDASMTMLKEKAMKGGIKLTLDFAPEAEVDIVADQRKLKQILFNLLTNAVKFTPAAGTVEVSVVRDGDFVEIVVKDTGIGIREEDIPKLFQAFTQLESAYTKGFEGTGLGLTLTRQLVELHGGRVWVKSDYGKGSRFSFTLPLTQAAANGLMARLPEGSCDHGSTVLVIEDDPRTLAALENALRCKGYRSLRASSGKEGVEMAQRNCPDLIVLDLVMPGMNGFEVAEQLGRESAAAHVPILVLTSMDLSAADRTRLEGKVWRIEGKGSLSTHEFLSLVESVVGPGQNL
jgi:PAS domain S-box-containing protein